MEASPAGVFTEILCYPVCVIPPLTLYEPRQLSGSLHLLHNCDVFLWKIFIFLNKHILASMSWRGRGKGASWKGCRLVYSDNHPQTLAWGASPAKWRNGSPEVITLPWIRQGCQPLRGELDLPCLLYGCLPNPLYFIILWRTLCYWTEDVGSLVRRNNSLGINLFYHFGPQGECRVGRHSSMVEPKCLLQQRMNLRMTMENNTSFVVENLL